MNGKGERVEIEIYCVSGARYGRERPYGFTVNYPNRRPGEGRPVLVCSEPVLLTGSLEEIEERAKVYIQDPKNFLLVNKVRASRVVEARRVSKAV
ncbi:hypothetical protein KKA02_03170 [Patescibacteria group bacterium]|nr:hypothetical protein [Patescibacteria group bacterium]